VYIDGGLVLTHRIAQPDYTYSGIGFSAATGGDANNNHILADFSLYVPAN
jgi:hypothetical protein